MTRRSQLFKILDQGKEMQKGEIHLGGRITQGIIQLVQLKELKSSIFWS